MTHLHKSRRELLDRSRTSVGTRKCFREFAFYSIFVSYSNKDITDKEEIAHELVLLIAVFTTFIYLIPSFFASL